MEIKIKLIVCLIIVFSACFGSLNTLAQDSNEQTSETKFVMAVDDPMYLRHLQKIKETAEQAQQEAQSEALSETEGRDAEDTQSRVIYLAEPPKAHSTSPASPVFSFTDVTQHSEAKQGDASVVSMEYRKTQIHRLLSKTKGKVR